MKTEWLQLYITRQGAGEEELMDKHKRSKRKQFQQICSWAQRPIWLRCNKFSIAFAESRNSICARTSQQQGSHILLSISIVKVVTFCVIRYIFPRVQVAGVNWPDQNNFVLPSCSGRLSKRQLGGWWWAGATLKETSEWQVFSGYGALESGQQLRWGRYRDWDEMTFGL